MLQTIKIKRLQDRHATSITQLSRDDIKALTRLLYMPMHAATPEDAHIFTTGIVASLPPHLRHSKFCDLFCTTLRLLPSGGAKSCASHRLLNTHLIHSIYQLIQLEVGPRLHRLVRHRSRLSAQQRTLVDSLRELNGMWMAPERFEREFGLPRSRAWYLQQDGCEACVLARIGQDAGSVVNLRTVLLSRTRTRGSAGEPPRLMRWVEETLECHGEKKLAMFMRSGGDARGLKAVRKEINKNGGAGDFRVAEVVDEEEIGIEDLKVEARTDKNIPHPATFRPPSSVYSGPSSPKKDNSDFEIDIIREYEREGPVSPLLKNEPGSPQEQAYQPKTGQLEHKQVLEIKGSTAMERESPSNSSGAHVKVKVPRSASNMASSSTTKTSHEWASEYQSVLNRDPRLEYDWEESSVSKKRIEAAPDRWSKLLERLRQCSS
ncbi:hypothetical protein PRK78_000014 [Emydomyces testavorans]|uniref:Uncharacterized protein n=1 Tax=Emydomyces testavorans TaxID=2070801 RepID=A0AAF0D9V6_9EURO|nr:hypothetical protein PRK78_000014 [Emydomyces testavorans]